MVIVSCPAAGPNPQPRDERNMLLSFFTYYAFFLCPYYAPLMPGAPSIVPRVLVLPRGPLAPPLQVSEHLSACVVPATR